MPGVKGDVRSGSMTLWFIRGYVTQPLKMDFIPCFLGFILNCLEQSVCSASLLWISFCLQTHSALYSLLMNGFYHYLLVAGSFFFPLSFLFLPVNKMINSVSEVLHSGCSVRRYLSIWLQPFLFIFFLKRAFLSALAFLISFGFYHICTNHPELFLQNSVLALFHKVG